MTHSQTSTISPTNNTGHSETLDYEAAAKQYYDPLYRFALSLSRNSVDAADMVQDAFHTLILKAGQIRDFKKLKSWLFTTLYRNYLQIRRRTERFPSCEFDVIQSESATISVNHVNNLDARTAMSCLESLSEIYRQPLILFYMEDKSYREIAETLQLPIGTVMSRLARGKMLLRKKLKPAGGISQSPLE